MNPERLRVACHEAGHATAAFMLDRKVVLVSIDTALSHFDGPCSIDEPKVEFLNGRRRPAAHWHELADLVVVVLCGPLAEKLADEYENPPLPIPHGERVPPPPPLAPADDEPMIRGRDRWQLDWFLGAMTTTEEEAAAFERALTLRAEAFVRHPHYSALHEHLTAALLREGTLDGDDVRVELQRAELRYTTQHMEAV
jgi:hypothetical protein